MWITLALILAVLFNGFCLILLIGFAWIGWSSARVTLQRVIQAFTHRTIRSS